MSHPRPLWALGLVRASSVAGRTSVHGASAHGHHGVRGASEAFSRITCWDSGSAGAVGGSPELAENWPIVTAGALCPPGACGARIFISCRFDRTSTRTVSSSG